MTGLGEAEVAVLPLLSPRKLVPYWKLPEPNGPAAFLRNTPSFFSALFFIVYAILKAV